MSKKNRDRGKSYERWLANYLGGRRVGLLGMEDVVLSTPPISIECKEREKLPESIKGWMAQAEANTPEDMLAMVCLHELNSSHEKDFVVIRLPALKVFLILLGGCK